MSVVEIILIAVVGLTAAGALWWLTKPLCSALRFLSDPQEGVLEPQALRPEDVHATHEELVSRP
jgi:hypothetical protein